MKIYYLGVLLLISPISIAEATRASVLNEINTQFRKINSTIDYVQIIDAKPKHSEYWVVARGINKRSEFKGRFDGELFGIFVISSGFLSIESTVDIFPTQRWGDYEVWIDKYTLEKITLKGHGATYKDNEIEKNYEVKIGY